jgi:hypothetical protein
MRALPLILMMAFVLLMAGFSTDSPHGKDFTISCGVCHSPKSWKLDKEIYSFDHNTTALPLMGQHQTLDCRACHISLVFSEAKTQCADCHTDMHDQTVGPDCGRCHTPKSWIIEDLTGMHQRSRFPLVGAHYTADCQQCHKSASLLRFEPLGIECIDCHQADYNGTTQPNHVESGFSTNCQECHSITSLTWTGAGFNHNFFPLTEGHANLTCSRCHAGGNYSNTSSECVSCHQSDYNNTNNPNHSTSNIPTTCADCHTTAPGWKPAEFRIHDAQYFPVYSGKHAGTWNTCADCHQNPSDYATFTCIDCHDHNQSDMDKEHQGVGGYNYSSLACYECHPQGNAEGAFNHNNSVFPLTGAHVTTPCSDCHASGFAGTPTACSACHINNYNQSTNPPHAAIGVPTTCADCHTTNPGWTPAQFPQHNEYFVLAGAHTAIDCNACHNGNYTSIPNTCIGCHQSDYNQTNNPPHASAQFPTDCSLCHTQSSWSPSTFNHDGQYFPIYSGKHQGTWNTCSQCHDNPADYSVFTCLTCHQQSQMNQEHQGVSGYSYNSNACYSCHPNGSAPNLLKPVIPVKKN